MAASRGAKSARIAVSPRILTHEEVANDCRHRNYACGAAGLTAGGARRADEGRASRHDLRVPSRDVARLPVEVLLPLRARSSKAKHAGAAHWIGRPCGASA